MPFDLSQYEPVEERIRAFWKDHPLGRIETELVEHADGNYIVRALVWTDLGEEDPRATGFAQEAMTPQHRVNATWPLENCETSAIGRALANLGYAAKGKRPSREEMSKTSPAGGPLSGEPSKAVIGAAAGDPQSVPEGKPGEDGTDQGPGEEGLASSSASPGSTISFPVSQTECDHRGPSGRWLPRKHMNGKYVCPRCGLDSLKYLET